MELTAIQPVTPRVNTHEPPRVDQRINSLYTRVGTHQKPAPTIQLYRTTSYRDREKRENITPQEEMEILENLTEI